MINFKDKIGVYPLRGKALENYKKMQCRPAYLQYIRKLEQMNKHSNLPTILPIPFKEFYNLMVAERRQANLF